MQMEIDTVQEGFSGQVHFPEQFRNELYAKFNIRESDVLDSIRNPDAGEIITPDGLDMLFFQKFIPQQPHPYFILSYGRIDDGVLLLDMSWKIPTPIMDQSPGKAPSQILRTLAGKFGLSITIGKTSKRFIWNEKFEIGDTTDEPIRIDNPDQHEYVQQIISKKISGDDGVLVHCLLGLCIDMTRYRAEVV